MKKIIFGCVAVLGCFSLPALAGDTTLFETRIDRNKPMLMNGDAHPRMQVVFEHTKHKGMSCLVCHHALTAEDNAIVSCSHEEGCHANRDRRSRDILSRFRAVHTTQSPRSCLGCHSEDPARRPFGCRDCHDGALQRIAGK